MLRNRQLMHVMSTIALSAVCSLLAVSNLLELFSTKAYTYIVWLVPLVFALCIGLLHHCMTKFSIVEVACLIVAQCIIAPIIVEHDTTALYILPTISTLYQGFQDFVCCWKLLISFTPPVDLQQGTYMVLWVLSFWFTYVNCRIATQSRRNRALMLMPVCLAQFALCAWLGGYHGFGRPFAGCALLVCLLLWFAWSAGATTQKRAILASLCTLLLAIPLSFSVESSAFLLAICILHLLSRYITQAHFLKCERLLKNIKIPFYFQFLACLHILQFVLQLWSLMMAIFGILVRTTVFSLLI